MKEDIKYRPIVIPKATIDLLLKEKEPLNLIGLYTFYYYVGIWQETNQPRAAASYVSEGLKIGKDKVIRLKKILIKLGLIKDVRVRDTNGKIIGHYIKVIYYAKKPPSANPIVWEKSRVVKSDRNAYSNNTINAYRNDNLTRRNKKVASCSQNKSSLFGEDSYGQKWGERLSRVIKINSKYRQPKTDTWIKEIRDLINLDKISQPRFERTIKWYIEHHNEKYCPQIYKIKDLRDKFARIVEARKRQLIASKEYDPDEDTQVVTIKVGPNRYKSSVIHI